MDYKDNRPNKKISKLGLITLIIFIGIGLVSTEIGLRGVITKLIEGGVGIGFGLIGIIVGRQYKKQFNIYWERQKSIVFILPVMVIVMFIVIGFGSGTINVYKAGMDLIQRETKEVIITNVELEKRDAGRGYDYYIMGVDESNNHVEFEIGRGAYEGWLPLDLNSETVIIIYYKYTKIIENAATLKNN